MCRALRSERQSRSTFRWTRSCQVLQEVSWVVYCNQRVPKTNITHDIKSNYESDVFQNSAISSREANVGDHEILCVKIGTDFHQKLNFWANFVFSPWQKGILCKNIHWRLAIRYLQICSNKFRGESLASAENRVIGTTEKVEKLREVCWFFSNHLGKLSDGFGK